MRSKSCCLLKLKLFLPSASAPLFGRSSASGSLSSSMSQPCHCGKMKRFAERAARLWKTWLVVDLPKVPRLPPIGIVCWKCEVAYGEMSAAVSGIFSTWQLQWGTRDGNLVFMFFVIVAYKPPASKLKADQRGRINRLKGNPCALFLKFCLRANCPLELLDGVHLELND